MLASLKSIGLAALPLTSSSLLVRRLNCAADMSHKLLLGTNDHRACIDPVKGGMLRFFGNPAILSWCLTPRKDQWFCPPLRKCLRLFASEGPPQPSAQAYWRRKTPSRYRHRNLLNFSDAGSRHRRDEFALSRSKMTLLTVYHICGRIFKQQFLAECLHNLLMYNELQSACVLTMSAT